MSQMAVHAHAAFGFCYWPWHLESLALALALTPQGLGLGLVTCFLGLGSQVLVNITAAQLSRPTRQRLDAFVVCTPQQSLRVLFTRSTWLSGTVTRCGLRSYSSSSKSTTLSIFFSNATSLHPPQQLHSTINSTASTVHTAECRCLIRPPHWLEFYYKITFYDT